MAMRTLGRFLRDQRRRSGLTQECFARRLGIDRSYLSRLECGYGRDLSHHVARRVASELGLTIEQLDTLLYEDHVTARTA
jgi:transcriptional regulator with XRE-family HTH domain